MRELRPQAGPQEAFCSTTADVAIYGGAAGGGKSWALCFEAGRNASRVGYHGAIFRRLSTQITGGGSIWEESKSIFPYVAPKPEPREHRLSWRFNGGRSTIGFHHLQYEKDVEAHRSKQYAFLGFDEFSQFTEGQFFGMLSRNRTTCGVPTPYVRATTNPDPDAFVRRLIDWWIGGDGYPIEERSGVVRYFQRVQDELIFADTAEELRKRLEPGHIPISLTFIPAKLSDNKILTEADPMYHSTLMSMPTVERERLLRGNWDIKAAAGLMFKRHFFEVVEEVPSDVSVFVRAWDLAATEPGPGNPDPDWTVGALWGRTKAGRLFICDIRRDRKTPGGTEQMILNTAKQDGPRVTQWFWQDPGQAGKSQIGTIKKLLTGFATRFERAAHNKTTYALPWSAAAERGEIGVVRGPWNDVFFTEAEGFPDASHDDIIDACSLGYMKTDRTALKKLEALARWR